MSPCRRLLTTCLLLALAPAAASQGRPDPAALLAAQRQAQAKLAFMDGVWRGQATHQGPDGQRHTVIQTERVGTMLDGSLRVIEGRGYGKDGTVQFSAFGVLSFDPATQSYHLHSHAMGRRGDFAVKPSADGFSWDIPAGAMTIRYTTTIQGDQWREVGERLLPGKEPVRFFEMQLQRVSRTDWPAAGAPGPQ